jgi:hypothetical protein
LARVGCRPSPRTWGVSHRTAHDHGPMSTDSYRVAPRCATARRSQDTTLGAGTGQVHVRCPLPCALQDRAACMTQLACRLASTIQDRAACPCTTQPPIIPHQQTSPRVTKRSPRRHRCCTGPGGPLGPGTSQRFGRQSRAPGVHDGWWVRGWISR